MYFIRVILGSDKGLKGNCVCFHHPNNLSFTPMRLFTRRKNRKKVKRASFKFIACKIFQYGFYALLDVP